MNLNHLLLLNGNTDISVLTLEVNYEDSTIDYIEGITGASDYENIKGEIILKPIFTNGKILNEDSLQSIRERISSNI